MSKRSTIALRCDRHLHGRLVAADADGGPYLEIACRHCRKDGDEHDHRWDISFLLAALMTADQAGLSPDVLESHSLATQ